MVNINASFFYKDALLVLDPQRRIQACNDEFLRLFTLDKAEQGADFDALFEAQDMRQSGIGWQQLWCKCRDTGKTACGMRISEPDCIRMVFCTDGRLQQLDAGADRYDERLSMLVRHMREGVALHRLIFKDGRAADYIIEDLNESFAELLGVRYADVVGQPASKALGTGKAPFLKKLEVCVKTGQPITFDGFIMRKSRHFMISVIPWGEYQFGTVISDLSESKHSQLLYKTLNEAAANMSDIARMDDIFASVANILKKNGFECMLLPFGENGSVTYLSFGEPCAIPHGGPVPVFDGEYEQAVRERRSVFIGSLNLPQALMSAGLSEDLKCIVSPLVVAGALAGVFAILSHALRKGDVEAVTAFANQLAAMMEKAALIGSLRAHIGKLEVSKKAHKEVAERLKMASRASRVGIWDIDIVRNVEYMDPALEKIYGLEPGTFDGRVATWRSLVHPEDSRRVEEAYHNALSRGKDYEAEYRIILPDGKLRFISSMGILHFDEGGKPVRMVGTDWDITERKTTEIALIAEKELLATTLKSIGDGVVVMDSEGRITLVNAQFEKLCGKQRVSIHGKSLSEVLRVTRSRDDDRIINLPDKALRSGRHSSCSDCTLLREDGKCVPVAYTASPIRDAEGATYGAVVVMRDITEEKRKQQKLDFFVYHDALTGVYNRRFFDQEIRKLDKPRSLPLSILSCDVNGLKLTNDAFGHSAGDKLLKRMANILVKASRPDDIVARVGGDEFMILMPGADERQAEKVCENIKMMEASGHSLVIDDSISVGYGTKAQPEENMREVISRAETNMYRNKTFESPSMRGSTIKNILTTLYEKYPRERAHAHQVSKLCCNIAKKLGFAEREIGDIKIVGLMHDIGKIAVNPDIFFKQDKLTEEEWTDVKRHTEIGFRILLASSDMAHIAKSVLSHHERYDGTGYPSGISGDKIPIMARIVAVAETYDAMISVRPYRKPISREDALRKIASKKGTQFDPAIVDVFLELMGFGE